jgi:NAD(P)-dependent dehydrogenase (short-subunit alcohol dehydrogenase family)
MATAKDLPPPNPSLLWRLWQGARGLEGTLITLPDADLRGKWVVMTGGNNGIGREAALRFASWGANIVLGCRQPPPHEKHPDVTVADCIASARAAGHESSTIEWWPCDMADLSTVEAFGNRWLSTGHTLDILANNAGMGRTKSGKLTKTIDGFEVVHQVNTAPFKKT